MFHHQEFDVIVIGGGHAGIEACTASARMGLNTLLLTHNIETLGEMSCNPAFGGIGKGHLIKEIDALGGVTATAIDHAGIQFRTLNSSKGPAVRATRAQTDRILYKIEIRKILENYPNLHIFQQPCTGLLFDGNKVSILEVKSGNNYKQHTALNNVLDQMSEYVERSIVLNKDNGAKENDIYYPPVYMAMSI